MSCNTRYWHSMKCSEPERPSNPALAKENNDNLQALLAARNAQDAKWNYTAPAPAPAPATPNQNPHSK